MEYKFTLKDLRVAMNLSKYDIAARLGLKAHQYFSIEDGSKKPEIDTLRDLAAMYGTSMDFVYHAFYNQGVKFDEINNSLEYQMRKSREKDTLFLGNWHRPPYLPVQHEKKGDV